MEVVTGQGGSPEERLSRLMALYEKDLLRLCAAYLRDRELAQDAVQETFLKAYRGLARFRGDCSEKTWLTGIAVNTCKNIRRGAWFRQAERRVPLDSLPLPAPAPTAGEDSVALAQEVMRLPPKEREAVLLYYYQGLQANQIARALGISAAAVSKRLKRARERLRSALKGGMENEYR